MKRRTFITGLAGAAAWPLAASAQQPALPLVGWLGVASSPDDSQSLTAAKQGLAETGFVEGRNFAFEYRFADYHPERLPGLAADLVRRRVAVMFTPTTAATSSLHRICLIRIARRQITACATSGQSAR
jgi:putative ABC transport system substrate-binding protein